MHSKCTYVDNNFCVLDPYREYFKPDIFSFGGDKVKMDFQAAHQSFDVYRIKIFENRDREEDVEAKCRHYSGEAGLTYKDCVLTSIKNDFEVSRFNGTLQIYSFTSVENLQKKIGCLPPWFAHEYSLVCNKSLTREDVDVLSTDVWGPFDASEFEDCVRPCVRMEIESRILR